MKKKPLIASIDDVTVCICTDGNRNPECVLSSDRNHSKITHKNSSHGILSNVQVERLLVQCERINKEQKFSIEDDVVKRLAHLSVKDYYINIGWIQALRTVLKSDTFPLDNSPVSDWKEKYDDLLQQMKKFLIEAHIDGLK